MEDPLDPAAGFWAVVPPGADSSAIDIPGMASIATMRIAAIIGVLDFIFMFLLGACADVHIFGPWTSNTCEVLHTFKNRRKYLFLLGLHRV
jgi:hypothetical protein